MSTDQLPRCPHCGMEYLPPAKTCPGCSRPLAAQSPEAPAPSPPPRMPGTLPGVCEVGPPPATDTRVDVDEVLREALSGGTPGESVEEAVERVVRDRFGAGSAPISRAILDAVRVHATVRQCSLEEAATEISQAQGELTINASALGSPDGSSFSSRSSSTITATSGAPMPSEAADDLAEASSHSTTHVEMTSFRAETREGEPLPPEIEEQVRQFLATGADIDEMPPHLRAELSRPPAKRRGSRFGCASALLVPWVLMTRR